MAATEEHQEKASRLEMKREIMRKKRTNRHESEHQELNITAMMDMMTIILVFLLKSLSSSAGNVPQDENLRLPHSLSEEPPSTAVQMIVSHVSVAVNGRFVVSLRNGYIDPSQKRGGAAGFLVNPLNDEMRNQHETALRLAERTHLPFDGKIAIIADNRTPARTIFEVLYTCAQNGFSNFQLLVLRAGAAQGAAGH